ncbi:MAG: hypothetical protein DHS20C05_09690 [Hyphococcus sp.]|nr:MAG: hypothetical protein DHS20C05_09690 [Marinicaulis sp.]
MQKTDESEARADQSILGGAPWALDPIKPELMDEPIEYFFAEHYRQRQAADALILVANGEYDKQGVERLINFLERDYARHVGDEEVGFFPLLRQQCIPEDNIESLIKRLCDEHKNEENIGKDVLALLKELQTGATMSVEKKRKLRVFAEHTRQHLAVENAVLLPIARVRMDEGSLKALSVILKQRYADEDSER